MREKRGVGETHSNRNYCSFNFEWKIYHTLVSQKVSLWVLNQNETKENSDTSNKFKNVNIMFMQTRHIGGSS